MATAEPSHPTATLVAQLASNAPEHHAATAAAGQAQEQLSAQAHSLSAVVALAGHREGDGTQATVEADHPNTLRGVVMAASGTADTIAALTPGQSHGLTDHQAIGAASNVSEAQPVEQAVAQAFEQVQRALASGLRVVRVRLEPPSLGVIDVRLSESAGVLRISFVTPHDAVRDVLIRGLDDLRQSLAVHGLTVHRIEVAPSLATDTSGTPSGASSWNSSPDTSSRRQNDALPWNTRAGWQQTFQDESSQPRLSDPPPRDETPRTVDYWA
jgi:flagellar hook-length control protein FliK